MAEFRDSIDISASSETVFEYLTANKRRTPWHRAPPTTS